MQNEITAEAAAAAAAYEITMDPATYTTRRVLTVGRSSMVHALDERMDLWAITHRNMAEGQTYSEAVCGQRSPSFNRNHGTAVRAEAVVVECKKCRRVMDNMVANAAVRAESERLEAEVAAAAAAEVVAEAPAAEVATEAPALAKGDVVTDKDGERFTVRRINANGSIRLIDELGTKVNRKAENLTKVS